MIENYSFTLSNNKSKLLKRVTWIWCFVLLLLLIVLISTKDYFSVDRNWTIIRFGTILFCTTVYYFLRKEKDILLGFQFVIVLISLAVLEELFGCPITLCFALFFGFIYWFTHQKTIVTFSPQNILIKTGFIKRQIEWDVLNNVILKDGILTLDFKNDKLIQEEVEGEAINEKFFLTFLQTKLQ